MRVAGRFRERRAKDGTAGPDGAEPRTAWRSSSKWALGIVGGALSTVLAAGLTQLVPPLHGGSSPDANFPGSSTTTSPTTGLAALPRFDGDIDRHLTSGNDKLLPFLRSHVGELIRLDVTIAPATNFPAVGQARHVDWSYTDCVYCGVELWTRGARPGIEAAHSMAQLHGYYTVEEVVPTNGGITLATLTPVDSLTAAKIAAR